MTLHASAALPMRLSSIGFLSLLQLVSLGTEANAQRPIPIGVGPQGSKSSFVYPTVSARRAVLFADSAESEKQPRAMPFVLAGAAVGGVVGALAASSYSCVEPQQYVTCTSMNPAAGAMIGIGVGAAVGGVVWALVRYRKVPPS